MGGIAWVRKFTYRRRSSFPVWESTPFIRYVMRILRWWEEQALAGSVQPVALPGVPNPRTVCFVSAVVFASLTRCIDEIVVLL